MQRPVITEQTSKKYKLIQLVGFFMCIGGIIAGFAKVAPAAVLLLLFGTLTFCVGRILAWWNHG